MLAQWTYFLVFNDFLCFFTTKRDCGEVHDADRGWYIYDWQYIENLIMILNADVYN